MITDKEEKVIRIISERFNLDYNHVNNIVSEELLNQSIENMIIDEPQVEISNTLSNTPYNLMTKIIDETVKKEKQNNLWINSDFKKLPQLQTNNVGKVGEDFIENICKILNIESNIDGIKTREKGGGIGDGKIKNKYIEIKTAHIGSNGSTFQHELGETPWKADYMSFIDIDTNIIYFSIFKNFSENQYRNCVNCEPYFPSRSFCHRKKQGAFKFDTTKKLNETAVSNNYTLKINKDTTFEEVYKFINYRIPT